MKYFVKVCIILGFSIYCWKVLYFSLDTCIDDSNTNKQAKTSSTAKDLATLYSSIANDFKRKKSTNKPDISVSINGNDNDGSGVDGLKVDAISEGNDDNGAPTPKTISPEALFAKAIIDGDQDGVRSFLETVESAETVATMQLNTQNINSTNGKTL